MRIDKWLWAVRIFKTRSQASNACRNGKVWVNDASVKPSGDLQPNDIVKVKKTPAQFTYKVLGLLEKRVSAKIAAEQVENLTPSDEIQKLKAKKDAGGNFDRQKGDGRPTKKERRQLDAFKRWLKSDL